MTPAPIPSAGSPAQVGTRSLIDAALAVRYDTISPLTLAKARHCLLDWFAVVMGASDELPVGMIRKAIGGDGAGEASAVGVPQTCSPASACLINGTAAHVQDYDDFGPEMIGHPTAPVATAIFAIAERQNATGDQILEAFIAGTDAQARLGLAFAAEQYGRGLHTTGTLGVMGAVVACGRLLDLSHTQFEHAVGLAATQASGLRGAFGSMAKALHVGLAARAAVLAADLAAGGFTGPREVIERDMGFAWTHSPESLGDGRGRGLVGHAVETVVFKRYAACFATHSAIEGARQVRAQGWRPQDILSVEIHLPEEALTVANVAEPTSGLEAKFSVTRVTAMALLGDDLGQHDFIGDSFDRPSVRDLAARIVVVPGRSQRGVPPTPLVVRVNSGEQIATQVDVNTPYPSTHLAEEESMLVDKFRSLTAGNVSASTGDRITEVLLDLGPATTVDECLTVLRSLPV